MSRFSFLFYFIPQFPPDQPPPRIQKLQRKNRQSLPQMKYLVIGYLHSFCRCLGKFDMLLNSCFKFLLIVKNRVR